MANQNFVIILNPTAGRGEGRRRRGELEALLAQQAARSSDTVKWRVVETAQRGDGTALARQAASEGADLVVSAGGDGTLHEVVNGLVGMDACLGILPLGTGNDFVRTLGIGLDLPSALETLFTGAPRRIDLGKAHGRWFINIAGCGFDAVVGERVNRGFRYLKGQHAYLASLALCLATFRPVPLRLVLDGTEHNFRAMMCSVANAQYYGGGMRITPEASLVDGLLDICVLGDCGRTEFVMAFPQVYKGTHVTHPKVTMLRGKTLTVESDPLLPVFADGDLLGRTPVTFEIVPQAITVMAPAGWR